MYYINILLILAAFDTYWYGYVAVAYDIKKPVAIEIEWILQGREVVQFQGFFTELLGILSEFKTQFPYLKLSKAYGNNSDHLINDTSLVWNDLFHEEAEVLRYLQDSYISLHHDIYKPTIQFTFANMSRILNESYCNKDNSLQQITSLSYVRMSRSYISSIADSHTCCMRCIYDPLCIAWIYDSNINTCHLQGRKSIIKSKDIQSDSLVTGDSFLWTNDFRHGRFPLPKVLVFHGTSCVYNNTYILQIPRDPNIIYIGRYMVERMPSSSNAYTKEELHVFSCAMLMDELWVPTEWNKQAYIHYARMIGSKLPPIYIVPEAVDTNLFKPIDITSCSKNDKDDGGQMEYQVDVNNHIVDISNKSDNKNKQEDDLFRFVSVFKWEHRKGWDILLSAYWSAFDINDNVELLLHTYRPTYLGGGSTNITLLLEQYALAEFGKSVSELARVVLNVNHSSLPNIDIAVDSQGRPLDHSIDFTRMQMRALYQISDVFVLPTRGKNSYFDAISS
jgi:glycosyltransferase involved in cell wall biosynthesis